MKDEVFYLQFLVAVTSLFHIRGRWDSVVGIANRLWARRSGVRILIRVRHFSLHKIFETGPVTHPVSCSVGTGDFPGREAVGA
jgi:predicted neutral ceramidase superfamily lipid hydrolase